jgi:hypothetical protein
LVQVVRVDLLLLKLKAPTVQTLAFGRHHPFHQSGLLAVAVVVDNHLELQHLEIPADLVGVVQYLHKAFQLDQQA